MEDSRLVSAIILMASLILGVASLTNYIINIEPQYNYIIKAREQLELAQKTELSSEKLYFINKSIEIYKTGISQQNLRKLIMLQNLTEKDDFDYWLPIVIDALNAEHDSLIPTIRNYATFIFEGSLIVASAIGTIGDYSEWSTNEKHFYIAVISALILATIVTYL